MGGWVGGHTDGHKTHTDAHTDGWPLAHIGSRCWQREEYPASTEDTALNRDHLASHVPVEDSQAFQTATVQVLLTLPTVLSMLQVFVCLSRQGIHPAHTLDFGGFDFRLGPSGVGRAAPLLRSRMQRGVIRLARSRPVIRLAPIFPPPPSFFLTCARA